MSDQLFLGAIIGPMYLILGLSILIYPKTWVKLVKQFLEDHFKLFGVMFFSIIFGLVIINSFNVWEWSPWVIITITGWAALIKGAVYFLLPGDVYKSLARLVNKKEILLVDSILITAVGVWLSYLVYIA